MNNIIFHNILILLYNTILMFFYFVDQINSAFIYFKIVKNCFQIFVGTLMIITILYTLLYYIVIMIIKCCFFTGQSMYYYIRYIYFNVLIHTFLITIVGVAWGVVISQMQLKTKLIHF